MVPRPSSPGTISGAGRVIAIGGRPTMETFAHLGLDWEKHVELDPKLIRPAEVEHLIGDSAKAQAQLGWKPLVDFGSLVKKMVDADLERAAAAPQLVDRLSTL